MVTIYVDVLITLNIYVNYFLLRITAAITGSRLKIGRCIAAAVYGSLFSLLILAPELGFFPSALIRTAAAGTIVMLAFGVHGRIRLLKDTAAFFASNFILAGVIYALCSWLRPEFIHTGNSFFYVDFSMLILIISTAGLYLTVSLIRRLSFAKDLSAGSYHVTIRYKNRSVVLSGLADTGNKLLDHFSGRPVIVCDGELFLTDPEINIKALPRGFRLIPCGTVSGSSVMPVFLPEEVLISNDESGEKKPVNVMIGLGKSSGKAIFDPSILKR